MAAKSFLREVAGAVTRVFGVQTSSGAANAGDIVALNDSGKIDSSMLATSGGAVENPLTTLRVSTDFLANTAADQSPFIATAFSSGSFSFVATPALVLGHPGIMVMRSSATANSGVRINTSGDMIVLEGGEVFDGIFYNAFWNSDITVRIGFWDGTTIATLADCAMFEITGNSGPANAIGVNSTNTAQSSTTSSYSLSAATWYHVRITLNSNATLVTYQIFDMSGALLWSDTLSTNIPTTGRAVGVGIFAWSSGTTGRELIQVDFIQFYRTGYVRGAL